MDGDQVKRNRQVTSNKLKDLEMRLKRFEREFNIAERERAIAQRERPDMYKRVSRLEQRDGL